MSRPEYLNIELNMDGDDEPFTVQSVEDYFEMWGNLKMCWQELAPLYAGRVVWTTYVIPEQS